MLISDEFTNPHQAPCDGREALSQVRRGRSTASRHRRWKGPEDADVTLLGWGSTLGRRSRKRCEPARRTWGSPRTTCQVKWIVPLHGDADRRRSLSRIEAGDHRREQRERPVRPLPAQRDRLRRRRPRSASTTASRSCRTTSWPVCSEQLVVEKTRQVYVPEHTRSWCDDERDTNVTIEPSRCYLEGLQGQGRPGLVSGLRRLRRAATRCSVVCRRAWALKPHRDRHRSAASAARRTSPVSSTPTACTRSMAARWRSRHGASRCANHEMTVICDRRRR